MDVSMSSERTPPRRPGSASSVSARSHARNSPDNPGSPGASWVVSRLSNEELVANDPGMRLLLGSAVRPSTRPNEAQSRVDAAVDSKRELMWRASNAYGTPLLQEKLRKHSRHVPVFSRARGADALAALGFGVDGVAPDVLGVGGRNGRAEEGDGNGALRRTSPRRASPSARARSQVDASSPAAGSARRRQHSASPMSPACLDGRTGLGAPGQSDRSAARHLRDAELADEGVGDFGGGDLGLTVDDVLPAGDSGLCLRLVFEAPPGRPWNWLVPPATTAAASAAAAGGFDPLALARSGGLSGFAEPPLLSAANAAGVHRAACFFAFPAPGSAWPSPLLEGSLGVAERLHGRVVDEFRAVFHGALQHIRRSEAAAAAAAADAARRKKIRQMQRQIGGGGGSGGSGSGAPVEAAAAGAAAADVEERRRLRRLERTQSKSRSSSTAAASSASFSGAGSSSTSIQRRMSSADVDRFTKSAGELEQAHVSRLAALLTARKSTTVGGSAGGRSSSGAAATATASGRRPAPREAEPYGSDAAAAAAAPVSPAGSSGGAPLDPVVDPFGFGSDPSSLSSEAAGTAEERSGRRRSEASDAACAQPAADDDVSSSRQHHLSDSSRSRNRKGGNHSSGGTGASTDALLPALNWWADDEARGTREVRSSRDDGSAGSSRGSHSARRATSTSDTSKSAHTSSSSSSSHRSRANVTTTTSADTGRGSLHRATLSISPCASDSESGSYCGVPPALLLFPPRLPRWWPGVDAASTCASLPPPTFVSARDADPTSIPSAGAGAGASQSTRKRRGADGGGEGSFGVIGRSGREPHSGQGDGVKDAAGADEPSCPLLESSDLQSPPRRVTHPPALFSILEETGGGSERPRGAASAAPRGNTTRPQQVQLAARPSAAGARRPLVASLSDSTALGTSKTHLQARIIAAAAAAGGGGSSAGSSSGSKRRRGDEDPPPQGHQPPASLASALAAAAKGGRSVPQAPAALRMAERAAVAAWTRRVVGWQQALCSAWALLLHGAAAGDVGRSAGGAWRLEGGEQKEHQRRLGCFSIRFGGEAEAQGNVITVLALPVATAGVASAAEIGSADASGSTLRKAHRDPSTAAAAEGCLGSIVAVIARSDRFLRDRLRELDLPYEAPLDPWLATRSSGSGAADDVDPIDAVTQRRIVAGLTTVAAAAAQSYEAAAALGADVAAGSIRGTEFSPGSALVLRGAGAVGRLLSVLLAGASPTWPVDEGAAVGSAGKATGPGLRSAPPAGAGAVKASPAGGSSPGDPPKPKSLASGGGQSSVSRKGGAAPGAAVVAGHDEAAGDPGVSSGASSSSSSSSEGGIAAGVLTGLSQRAAIPLSAFALPGAGSNHAVRTLAAPGSQGRLQDLPQIIAPVPFAGAACIAPAWRVSTRPLRALVGATGSAAAATVHTLSLPGPFPAPVARAVALAVTAAYDTHWQRSAGLEWCSGIGGCAVDSGAASGTEAEAVAAASALRLRVSREAHPATVALASLPMRTAVLRGCLPGDDGSAVEQAVRRQGLLEPEPAVPKKATPQKQRAAR